MKKILAKFLVLAVLFMVLAGCQVNVNTKDPDDPNNPNVPDKYKDFYNYPTGRKDPAGTLEIRNSVASQVLVFTNDVTGPNYIGTIGSLDKIKVSLPEQKFYTIVAVDKKNWEERGDQAERFSDLAFYSRQQPYSMAVNPSSMYGGASWVIVNRTSYWVSFKKSDNSGEIYAVVAPNTLRATIPMQFDKSYDYIPHFYKELKYQGVVIAIAESDDVRNANTAYVRSGAASKTFNTEIGVDIAGPSTNIKPAVFATNSLQSQSARVYYGTNNQLSNGAIDDLVLVSGDSFIFTGLNEDNNINQVNFNTLGWGRLYVQQSMVMQKNKVYKINVTGSSETNYSTTATEVDATDFYQ